EDGPRRIGGRGIHHAVPAAFARREKPRGAHAEHPAGDLRAFGRAPVKPGRRGGAPPRVSVSPPGGESAAGGARLFARAPAHLRPAPRATCPSPRLPRNRPRPTIPLRLPALHGSGPRGVCSDPANARG